MMLRVNVALCLLAGVFAAVAVYKKSGPEFCHGLDCPRYSVLRTYAAGYELRRYVASKWVATNFTSIEFTEDDRRKEFTKLFYYISGNNSAHTKIPMTAPVLVQVYHGAGPDCESTFITHFMVPFAMQVPGKAPIPTDPSVYLRDIPTMDAFVQSFGGRPTVDDYTTQLQNLTDEIADGTKYNDTSFFFAGYDDPYAIKRHNEVWLQAKN